MSIVFAQAPVVITSGSNIEGVPIPAPASGQVQWHQNKPFCLGYESFSIKIENNQVFAPISGVIDSITPKNGSIVLMTKSKLKFEICFDPCYSEFFGQGIQMQVRVRQAIRKGQLLMELDLFKMKNNLTPLLLFVKVFNLNKYKKILMPYQYVEANQDPLLSLIVNTKK